MVIDSSALLAVIQEEEGSEALLAAIEDDETRLISAATVLEATLVLEGRFGDVAGRELDLLISKVGIEIVPVDHDQLAEARRGWRRFGRGRHEAGLNYGDLFSYALSRTSGEALLFKGGDFTLTDVARVL
jgi:ribonuclease VapC